MLKNKKFKTEHQKTNNLNKKKIFIRFENRKG